MVIKIKNNGLGTPERPFSTIALIFFILCYLGKFKFVIVFT